MERKHRDYELLQVDHQSFAQPFTAVTMEEENQSFPQQQDGNFQLAKPPAEEIKEKSSSKLAQEVNLNKLESRLKAEPAFRDGCNHCLQINQGWKVKDRSCSLLCT